VLAGKEQETEKGMISTAGLRKKSVCHKRHGVTTGRGRTQCHDLPRRESGKNLWKSTRVFFFVWGVVGVGGGGVGGFLAREELRAKNQKTDGGKEEEATVLPA